jgi:hypothetical protein
MKMKEQILGSQVAMVLTDGIALGYRYDHSPVVCPDDSAATADDPTRYVPTARPGSRAPHAWVREGQSVLDLFGRGFVLLRFGADAPDGGPIEHAFHERQVPISVTTITDPVIAQAYQRKLVLVRPDGHVAWRGDTLPADPAALADRVRGMAAETVPS